MSTPAAEAYAKAKEPTHTQLGLRELSHADRCDACGAQAWVRTESYYSALPLLWCAHHYTEVERTGYFGDDTHKITDERNHLRAAVKAQAGVA